MVNMMILDMRLLSDGMVGSCSDDTAKIPCSPKNMKWMAFG